MDKRLRRGLERARLAGRTASEARLLRSLVGAFCRGDRAPRGILQLVDSEVRVEHSGLRTLLPALDVVRRAAAGEPGLVAPLSAAHVGAGDLVNNRELLTAFLDAYRSRPSPMLAAFAVQLVASNAIVDVRMAEALANAIFPSLDAAGRAALGASEVRLLVGREVVARSDAERLAVHRVLHDDESRVGAADLAAVLQLVEHFYGAAPVLLEQLLQRHPAQSERLRPAVAARAKVQARKLKGHRARAVRRAADKGVSIPWWIFLVVPGVIRAVLRLFQD
jgi:hypothetical protein